MTSETFGRERSCVIEQETLSTKLRAHTTGFVIAELEKRIPPSTTRHTPEAKRSP